MWYKFTVNEKNIPVLKDRVWEAEAAAAPDLGEFLLDDSEFFLKVTELGAFVRVIIPTP